MKYLNFYKIEMEIEKSELSVRVLDILDVLPVMVKPAAVQLSHNATRTIIQ